MKNKRGLLLIFSGLCLIAASLCMAAVNIYESVNAAKSVERVNSRINIEKAQQTEEVPLYISHPEIEMPVEEIDGNLYIGVLEIPDYELKLPVISRWSDAALRVAPCRYTGSAYMDNMIVAAHDYRRHFAKIKKLEAGAPVYFTDIDGNRFEYKVLFREVLPPDAVEDMLAGDWDLTLFTCTSDAANRVTVRCERTE
ncbi:MAG: sortase [Oscillospiraceae bacterium]|nr:sortase [Oscillospiraceae bacterium]